MSFEQHLQTILYNLSVDLRNEDSSFFHGIKYHDGARYFGISLSSRDTRNYSAEAILAHEVGHLLLWITGQDHADEVLTWNVARYLYQTYSGGDQDLPEDWLATEQYGLASYGTRFTPMPFNEAAIRRRLDRGRLDNAIYFPKDGVDRQRTEPTFNSVVVLILVAIACFGLKLARPQMASEAVPEAVPAAVPEAVPEAVPAAVPEAVFPEAAPEAVPEAIPEAIPEAVPEAIPEALYQQPISAESLNP